MNRLQALAAALLMTKWFFVTSWSYVVTEHISSKLDFFVGVIPAWVSFTKAAYLDYLRGVHEMRIKWVANERKAFQAQTKKANKIKAKLTMSHRQYKRKSR